MAKKTLFITIDDAPSDDMPKKLDLLDELGINVCWFVLGDNVAKRRDLLLRALKRGDRLANHSFRHPFFSKISVSKAKKEIFETEKLIQSLYDEAEIVWSKKYFRFPYGDSGLGSSYGKNSNKKWSLKFYRIQKFLKKMGYVNPDWDSIWLEYKKPDMDEATDKIFNNLGCYWSFDVEEWKIAEDYRTPVAQENQLLLRLDQLANRAGCELLLIHDHNHSSNLFELAMRWFKHKDFDIKLLP